jgi:hypothetical protein
MHSLHTLPVWCAPSGVVDLCSAINSQQWPYENISWNQSEVVVVVLVLILTRLAEDPFASAHNVFAFWFKQCKGTCVTCICRLDSTPRAARGSSCECSSMV